MLIASRVRTHEAGVNGCSIASLPCGGPLRMVRQCGTPRISDDATRPAMAGAHGLARPCLSGHHQRRDSSGRLPAITRRIELRTHSTAGYARTRAGAVRPAGALPQGCESRNEAVRHVCSRPMFLQQRQCHRMCEKDGQRPRWRECGAKHVKKKCQH